MSFTLKIRTRKGYKTVKGTTRITAATKTLALRLAGRWAGARLKAGSYRLTASVPGSKPRSVTLTRAR